MLWLVLTACLCPGSQPYSILQISSGPTSVNHGMQFRKRWAALLPLTFTLVCLICQLLTASKETSAAMITINLQPEVMQAICYITAVLAGISIFVGAFFVADTTGERSYVGSCCTGGFVLFFSLVGAVLASLIVNYWNQGGGQYICGDLPACQDAKSGMTFAWISFCTMLLAEISWCVINKRPVIEVSAPVMSSQRMHG